MDPRLKIILHGNPEEELSLLMRLNDAGNYPMQTKIVTQFGDIVTCRIKRKNIFEVYNSKEVKSLKAPNVVPAVAISQNETDVINNKQVTNSLPIQKSNVVFGIIDFGFDFTHADFIDAGETRFEKIWVQSGNYDTNNYGYGKIIDSDDLNDALEDEFPFKKVGYHPGASDLFGAGTHGTHVLGIACSNGSVAKKAYASESPIIAVDMGSNLVNGSNLSLGDSVKLVEGLHFLLTEAKGRPIVINMSLGGHGDSHTGKTLVEQAIDQILLDRKGTAIVQSVGNYHLAKAHTCGCIKQNEKIKIPWLFKKKDKTPNELEIWYEGDDVISVIIYDENNKKLIETIPFKDEIISLNNDEIGICLHRKNEPNTGKNQIDIILNGDLNLKYLFIELVGKKINKGNFHCYIERDDNGQSIFDTTFVKQTHTTNSICNSFFGISVGAYNQDEKQKSILNFSSSGPTVDGRMKPEVLAPGSKIISSCSSSSKDNKASRKLCSKSGSSMASPFVASLLIKILEKQPHLNIFEIRKKLLQSCDPFYTENKNLEIFRAGNGYINPNKILT